jgi:hypothetical protein
MAAKTAAAANAKLVAATLHVSQLVSDAEEHQQELKKVGSVDGASWNIMSVRRLECCGQSQRS